MHMSLGAALCGAGACDGPRGERGSPRARDKAALYGDPALVPTRAGERAREELARAAAVADALGALGAADLRVEVRLPLADDPGAVVVAGRAPPGVAEAEIRGLVQAVCGPWSAAVVRLALLPAAPGRPPGRGAWPLYLALVGLGASAGVTVDRLRRRG